MCFAVVKITTLSNLAIIPDTPYYGDSGSDLYSIDDVTIRPGERMLVHTGLALEIPEGFEGVIRPRSGNAIKLGLTVLNTPGTLDANYRGEVCVILYNASDADIDIHVHDRIAQLVIQELPRVYFKQVNELSSTDRGDRGFGSSGR